MKDFADEFVDLACLCYDDPHFDHRSFHVRAHDMLQKSPELAESNIWSAASAGNAAAVRSFLDKSPDLVNQPGGPHSWVPLICACYSRVQPVDSEHSTFQVAKLLLDHGADPKPIPPSTMTLQAVTAGAASLRWRACSGAVQREWRISLHLRTGASWLSSCSSAAQTPLMTRLFTSIRVRLFQCSFGMG